MEFPCQEIFHLQSELEAATEPSRSGSFGPDTPELLNVCGASPYRFLEFEAAEKTLKL